MRRATLRRHLASASTVLASAGIGYVGVSYLTAPEKTAPSFGFSVWPQGRAAEFLAVKGARDLVSGLVPMALLISGQRRALGTYLAVETVVPALDAALVLRARGSTRTALAVHGVTAAVLAATAVALLTED